MVDTARVSVLTNGFAALDKWAEKPAFGTPLEEHLKRSGREIALPIEACVMLLLETGMKEEVRVPWVPCRCHSPGDVPVSCTVTPVERQLRPPLYTHQQDWSYLVVSLDTGCDYE